MEWIEVLESTELETVNSLLNRRLLIRRGNKLNLYWDIFRDCVLTESIPHIPFSHVPQSPSLKAFVKTAMELDPLEPKSLEDLSRSTDFSVSTIRNIIHDLSIFGIASINRNMVSLENHIGEISPLAILNHVRIVLRRHALTEEIMKQHEVPPPAKIDSIVKYLKKINPTAKHHSRTWLAYANRMIHWLYVSGYIVEYEQGWLFDDYGKVRKEETLGLKGKRKSIMFTGEAPPFRVIEALEFIKENGPQPLTKIKSIGYRNALSVLRRIRN